MVAFQYMKGAYKKDGERLLIKVRRDMTRNNSFKEENSYRLDIRKSNEIQNKLPGKVVDAPSQETFKDKLDRL